GEIDDRRPALVEAPHEDVSLDAGDDVEVVGRTRALVLAAGQLETPHRLREVGELVEPQPPPPHAGERAPRPVAAERLVAEDEGLAVVAEGRRMPDLDLRVLDVR